MGQEPIHANKFLSARIRVQDFFPQASVRLGHLIRDFWKWPQNEIYLVEILMDASEEGFMFKRVISFGLHETKPPPDLDNQVRAEPQPFRLPSAQAWRCIMALCEQHASLRDELDPDRVMSLYYSIECMLSCSPYYRKDDDREQVSQCKDSRNLEHDREQASQCKDSQNREHDRKKVRKKGNHHRKKLASHLAVPFRGFVFGQRKRRAKTCLNFANFLGTSYPIAAKGRKISFAGVSTDIRKRPDVSSPRNW